MLSRKTWNEMDNFARHKIESSTRRTQIEKAAEELGELQREMFKALSGRTDMDGIAEEMGDVFIMLKQIALLFDVQIEEVEDWIAYKIARESDKNS